MPTDRRLERTLIVWIPAVVVLHLAGGRLLGGSAWGFHIYMFYPAGVGITAAALLGLTLLLARHPGTRLVRAVAALPDPTAGSAARRLGVGALAALLAGGVFWSLRLGHTLLGDGNAVVLTLPTGEALHPRSPLTQLVLRGFYDVFAARSPTDMPSDIVAQNAAAASSVVAGMMCVPIAWALACELVRLRTCFETPRSGARTQRVTPTVALTWLVTAALLTQGYVQLFFGYIEHYTFYLLALATYFWLALRNLRGATSFLTPALAAAAACAFHFSGAVLVPSLVVLLAVGLADPKRRRATLRDLLVVAVACGGLVTAATQLVEGFAPIADFKRVFSKAVLESLGNFEAMTSGAHVRDFLNQQLLIGPLGLAVLIPGAFWVLRDGLARTRAGAFLLVTGASFFATSWIASEPFLVLGYAREWDMLAPAGLAFTALGLGSILITRREASALTVPLVWAVALSLFHSVPWITLNASGPRSVERIATLPLGEGRAATTVGTWYMRHGTDAQAIEWFERALAEYPRNVNAWDKLGLVYAGQNRMAEAAEAYRRAVEIRPDKLEYRQNLVEALRLSSRFEESLPHNEWLCERQPGNLEFWLRLISAYEQTGRAEAVAEALRRAHAGMAAAQQRAPQDYLANFNLGVVLMALDRPAEALAAFERAHARNPESDLPLVNIGAALVRLGRGAEARPYLERARARTRDAQVRKRATELLQAAKSP